VAEEWELARVTCIRRSYTDHRTLARECGISQRRSMPTRFEAPAPYEASSADGIRQRGGGGGG